MAVQKTEPIITSLRLEGRALFLISGGIDSPVAAWLLVRKGIEPTFAYFDNYPLCDQAAEGIALDTIRKLCDAAKIKNTRTYLIAHSPDLRDIVTKCPVKFACILSRRLMFRISEKLAIREGCAALVTGDAIGQKASQTLENIVATDCVLEKLGVLRPLVGMNKLQIEKIARQIGTYEISIRPGVSSCGVPTNKPSTNAQRVRLEEIEKALDIKLMVNRAVDNARILTL
jgi:thiamine biosynthesis protein ThiI